MFDGDNILKSPHETLASNADALTQILGDGKARRSSILVPTIVCIVLALVAGAAVANDIANSQHSPGFWQNTLIALLFWFSVSQGMLVFSALLRLTHASWRYPLTRFLDMSSLFGVWCIVLLPLLAVARARVYGMGMSTEPNNIWREAGPIGWDSLFVVTGYVAGWALLWLTSRPDFAVLRDRATAGSAAQKRYARFAGGWIGAGQQWQVLRRAESLLVVGVVLAFVGGQAALGWDMQLGAGHDWESGIFGHLYCLTALLGGMAMTILVMSLLKSRMRGSNIFSSFQYDNIAKTMIGFGLLFFYFRFCDFVTAWYGHMPNEWRIQTERTSMFPAMFALEVVCCFAVPVFANIQRTARQSAPLQCLVAVLVLIGIWSERFLDTVPAFAPKFEPSLLMPDFTSLLVFIGVGSLFVLTYLIAGRIFPLISWWGMNKSQARTSERKMGNTTVTVMVEDPPVWGL